MQTPINIHAERNRKISQTMREKRARGEVAGRLPMGYTVAQDAKGNPIRVEDPNEQFLLSFARELQNQGVPIRKIADAWTSVCPSQTTKAVSASTLWRALKKPTGQG